MSWSWKNRMFKRYESHIRRLKNPGLEVTKRMMLESTFFKRLRNSSCAVPTHWAYIQHPSTVNLGPEQLTVSLAGGAQSYSAQKDFIPKEGSEGNRPGSEEGRSRAIEEGRSRAIEDTRSKTNRTYEWRQTAAKTTLGMEIARCTNTELHGVGVLLQVPTKKVKYDPGSSV